MYGQVVCLLLEQKVFSSNADMPAQSCECMDDQDSLVRQSLPQEPRLVVLCGLCAPVFSSYVPDKYN